MTAAAAVIPLTVGAVLMACALAEVPPERRHVEWPALLGVAAVAGIAATYMLGRRAVPGGPGGGQFARAGGAVVFPFRLPHAA